VPAPGTLSDPPWQVRDGESAMDLLPQPLVALGRRWLAWPFLGGRSGVLSRRAGAFGPSRTSCKHSMGPGLTRAPAEGTGATFWLCAARVRGQFGGGRRAANGGIRPPAGGVRTRFSDGTSSGNLVRRAITSGGGRSRASRYYDERYHPCTAPPWRKGGEVYGLAGGPAGTRRGTLYEHCAPRGAAGETAGKIGCFHGLP